MKIRVWDKKEKRFHYSDKEHCFRSSGNFSRFYVECEDGQYKWLDGVAQLFTGVEDENGKEIYEGDIISYLGYSAYGRDSEKSIEEIKWDKNCGGFELRWLTEIDDGDIGLGIIDIEVIGNIYENDRKNN